MCYDSNSRAGAAVCILESHAPHVENKVRGLVRMVEVAPSMTIIDLSIRGLSPGTYHATVRESGNICDGPESTGAIWEHVKATQEGKPCRGIFGTVQVGKNGVGSVFLDRPIDIWEMIGRSIVVAREQDGKVCETASRPEIYSDLGQFDKNDADTLVGVIARSAGVWDSECSRCPTCSASGGSCPLDGCMLTAVQTTRRYVRVPERRSGRRGRSSATVACYEFKTDQDRPSSPKVPSKCRVGLVRRDKACTLKSRPKLGLREHGLCKTWHSHAFMPEVARRPDEWLRG